MLAPCSPHTHDVRTTVADRSEDERLALAGQLRRPVDPERVRAVELVVGAVEPAVEHVVGGDVDEVGADRDRTPRRPSAPPGR